MTKKTAKSKGHPVPQPKIQCQILPIKHPPHATQNTPLDDINTSDQSTNVNHPSDHGSNSNAPQITPSTMIIPLHRSNRINNQSSAIIASKEFEKHEADAREAGETWASNYTANLTKIVDEFGEVDGNYNMALTAMGLPPIPKNYSAAMEDQARWEGAIQKEME
ncbi:hypothetical protein DFH05DRAFT_1529623 [Lentinula detonsa]|uniref:Uncharacterized protein n=1 Tax=Lentinula detonsa TaxID=2804962 RepID=A0A9W8TTQ1_9AGAR|nr:hypothetical protein DFH05DRAFT_1529623 [Lentinula detonsa]